MREWKFWDWTGYLALFFAVLFLALVEGVKKLPEDYAPDFMGWSIWAFLPLLLFTLGSVTLFLKQLGWIGVKSEKNKFLPWPEPYTPTLVIEKKFINERVVLDGRAFYKCEFHNVTYVYNGTTTIQISGCDLRGRIRYDSDNPAVKGTILLLDTFGMLNDRFRALLPPEEDPETIKKNGKPESQA